MSEEQCPLPDEAGDIPDGDILMSLVAASENADDLHQRTTIALASWILSTPEGARRLQEDAVSSYCRRLLRASLPPCLYRMLLSTLTTGLTRALRANNAPLPTPGCVLLFTHLAHAASFDGDRILQAQLLAYFAKFHLAERPECHGLGAALVASAMLLPPASIAQISLCREH